MELIIKRTLFFMIFVSSIVAEIHHKRSPQGFQGVRGKRDTNIQGKNLTDIAQQKSLDPIFILKPTVTTTNGGSNNNEYSGPHFISQQSPPLAIVKRAPVGFMGMRGKKDYEYTDFKNNGLFMEEEQNTDVEFAAKYPFQRFIPKRAPSGFMGMRGKKLIDNDYNGFKRIPSGFVGMRGKKPNDDIFTDNYLHNNEHRFSNDRYVTDEYDIDLLDNKEREDVSSDFSKLYGLDNNNNYNNILLPNNNNNNNNNNLVNNDVFAKRVPSSGFFGMRGKKLSSDLSTEENINENGNKRAPSSAGFFGMRGKKWSEEIDEQLNDGGVKRAPSNGFFGMRGKKDVANVLLNEEKRIPSSGFFGMRGKKVPTGFFGMRGKKGPYEFRGKFVGVRGKKTSLTPLRQLTMDLNKFQPELQSAILIGSEMQPNKRGPTGFFGMRGKKWDDSAEN